MQTWSSVPRVLLTGIFYTGKKSTGAAGCRDSRFGGGNMNLKKAVIPVVLLVMVFAGCQKKENNSLTIKPGVLTVGMDIGYPPMEHRDDSGNPVGFDIEMANAIAAKLGVSVEFIDTAWDGIFAGVDKGEYVCFISSVTITDARLAALNFT
jgi:polar amino acid transport system substrate-binding protein